jgi:hypothetical protein
MWVLCERLPDSKKKHASFFFLRGEKNMDLKERNKEGSPFHQNFKKKKVNKKR